MFKGLVVGRSKSHHGMDTQIYRMVGGFRKNESSDGIHELVRDGAQNSGGLGDASPVDEYLDRPIPKVTARGERRKRNDPNKKKKGAIEIFRC